MGNEYGIDSHKIMYHPARLSEWLAGKNIYPICVEISPSGCCNHRCIFCAFDYLKYEPVFLDEGVCINNMAIMASKGVRSIVVCGEGEPLLNPATPNIIHAIYRNGMDAAMSTNGVLLSAEIAENCLPSLTWIRFSLNAGTSKTYQAVHCTSPNDFERAITNIQRAVEIKHSKSLKTTIGVQLLLVPENAGEVVALAKTLREIGVDYFTVKPYSRHPKSIQFLDGVEYDDYEKLERQLQLLETEAYRIIFRSQSMKKLGHSRAYNGCWGLPFWAYIDSHARVWGCLAYIGDDDFYYGNLTENDFSQIWEGEQRLSLMKKMTNLNVENCRELCRLDKINAYLESLKNPHSHVNFI